MSLRREIEAALKESERNLDSVFDAIPLPLAIVRKKDSKLLKVSRANFEFHGITREELLQTHGRDIYVNPEDYNRLHEKLAEKGRVDPFEIEVKKYGSGEKRWGYISAYPINYFGEEALVSAFQDITPIKELEAKYQKLNEELEERVLQRTKDLQISENRLRKLNQIFLSLGRDSDRNIQVLTDACGELLEATYAFYDKVCGDDLFLVNQWGAPKDFTFTAKVEGFPSYEVVKRGKEAGTFFVANLLESSFNDTCSMVSQYGLKTYIGHPVTCYGDPVGTLSVLYKEDMKLDPDNQKVIEIIASAISIEEERKQAQSELKFAKDEAEEANKLKDKFVSLVSHDFRSPFNSIVGFLKVLESEAADRLKAEEKEMINKVLDNCDYMLKMITGILDLSRIRTGKITLGREFVDGGLITGLVLENMKLLAEKKGIRIVNEIPFETRLFVDMELFQEVIRNLVSNAIKFCREGDQITISVSMGNEISLVVKDSGIGIPPDLLGKLFKREEKTTTIGTAGEKGTGLGLPFSSEIMTVHGGSLSVESEVGKGSTFFAKLPIVDPVVLVVDDLEADRFLISKFLDRLNVKRIETKNGNVALEILKDSDELPHLNYFRCEHARIRWIRIFRSDKKESANKVYPNYHADLRYP